MSDQPISLTPQGPPRTVLPAEPAAVRHALQQALAAPADRAARHARRGGRCATLGRSSAGRRSATSAATRSSGTPPTAWATTAVSTRCAPTAGVARATCAGPTRPNRGFLGCLRGLGADGRRHRRDRRGRTHRPVPRASSTRPAAGRLSGRCRCRRRRAVRRCEPADGHRQGAAAGRRRADGGARGRRRCAAPAATPVVAVGGDPTALAGARVRRSCPTM